jgi:hypothetical protein
VLLPVIKSEIQNIRHTTGLCGPFHRKTIQEHAEGRRGTYLLLGFIGDWNRLVLAALHKQISTKLTYR